MLKGMARFKSFKPCFHKYLPNQIVSKLVKIDAPDWEIALFLPVENFVKKGKSYVWQQSSEIIDGTRKGPSSDGLPKGTKKTPTSTVTAVQKTVSTNGLPKKKEV